MSRMCWMCRVLSVCDTVPKLVALAAWMFAGANAGAQGVAAAAGEGADRVPLDSYIHASWAQLERSMVDCKSLVDTKTRTAPVLYLPHGMAVPEHVKALHAACGVDVEQLPRTIDHPGALMPAEIERPGLLYLPHPYVVPGGRFNEQYGWDSYFILLGLVHDERLELAQGMVENFFFEIAHYGELLNANRTYYLTRSQPPLLSSMIRMVYDAEVSATPQGYRKADAWLAEAYAYAEKDHALWVSPEHAAGDTRLARYHDLGEGPVPEMADDSTYYPDVIRWLLAHPEVKTGYLAAGPADAVGGNAAEVAKLSCDPVHSEVCAHAHVGTMWLTRAFYEGDRADRESGFDATFRWGPFAGSTEDYAPVGLNALLYKYEIDLAWMAGHLHKDAEADKWKAEATARKKAIDTYLWSPQTGMYFDYDFVTKKQSTYDYVTAYYPLWAGAADAVQQKAVDGKLGLFLRAGGVAMSTTESGVQWDLPYGWAPTTYFAVAGLVRAGDAADARTVAERFLQSVKTEYAADGTIREKYNVVQGDANVHVVNGYRQNVIGFGWTNGVCLKLEDLVAATPEDAAAAIGLER